MSVKKLMPITKIPHLHNLPKCHSTGMTGSYKVQIEESGRDNWRH